MERYPRLEKVTDGLFEGEEAVLLAWASRVLVLASSTYDGIQPEHLGRVTWPARIGCACVIPGAGTQSFALWLA